MVDEFLTSAQAAALAFCDRNTIAQAIRRKRLKATWSQQFHRWLIKPSDLNEWRKTRQKKSGYPKGRPRKNVVSAQHVGGSRLNMRA